MYKFCRLSLMSMATIIVSIFLMFGTASAQSTVKIVVVPDIRIIRIGSDVHKITVIARVSGEGLQFEWEINGPGKLSGDITSREVAYIPPHKIDSKSADIEITVTATDLRGNGVSDSVTLTIVSSPVPSEQSLAQIPQLLKKADSCFDRTFFVEPKEDNAFDLYKQVLQIDPANLHAREKIHEMLMLYNTWGNSAYHQRNYTKAQRYYQRYLLIAEYVLHDLGGQRVKQEFQKVQKRLTELQPLLSPTPRPTFAPTPPATLTPTPTPTSIPSLWPISVSEPTVSPPQTPTLPPKKKNLEELQQTLPKLFEKYEELIKKEKQGANINNQIIGVIQEIIDNLIEIERLLQKMSEKTSENYEILKRIETTITIREEYEKELLDRNRR